MREAITARKPVTKQEIGMLLFIATEIMLFAGLISAYVVLKSQISMWPPVDQPRFPVAITGFNTLILLLSGLSLFVGFRNFKDKALSLKLMFGAVILGAVFLLIQGYEWVQLIQFGLATAQSVYAGTFYVLIGTHALHAFGGLIFLLTTYFSLKNKVGGEEWTLKYKLSLMYWSLVVGVWPVLYGVVYF